MSKLNKKVFCSKVAEGVKEVLGDKYSVQFTSVTKTNDTVLNGITVKPKDTRIAAVIYLDSLYEDYKIGMPIKYIVREVASRAILEGKSKFQENIISMFEDFDCVKDKIAYKLVGIKSNSLLLKDIPYIVFNNLAIVFYIVVDVNNDESNVATILIKNEHLNLWGVTVTDLYKFASTNTEKIFKPIFKSMSDMLHNLLEDEEGAEYADMLEKADEVENELFVVSNDMGINGACVMLYKGFLTRVADKLNVDSLIILPSSIHELIIVKNPCEISPDGLKSMVYEINRTQVAADEVLSDSVYLYTRDTDRITILRK